MADRSISSRAETPKSDVVRRFFPGGKLDFFLWRMLEPLRNNRLPNRALKKKKTNLNRETLASVLQERSLPAMITTIFFT